MKAFVFGLVVLACLGAGAAASANKAAPARPKDAPEQTWRASCGYCHGGAARAVELRGLNLPEEFMIRTAREGAAGMPPFHPSAIDDAELRALVHWIARQSAPAAQPELRSQPAPAQ